MSGRSLGGAERRVAPGGVGSSPADLTFPATNNKKVLRRMLRDRDRILCDWDAGNDTIRRYLSGLKQPDYLRLDNERRLIRLKLKSPPNRIRREFI